MKKENGITLVALIVSIIILLILATVSVQVLMGDNGLITKTETAKEKNAEAIAMEKIQVQVAGSYGFDGRIDIVELNKNLKRINDIKYKGLDLILEGDNKNCIEGLPVIVTLSDYDFIIEKNGSITNIQNMQPTEIIYVALYNDGTLDFSNDNEVDSNKTLLKTYTIEKDKVFETSLDIPWKDDRNSITNIDFKNLIIPLSTKRWFEGCTQLQNLYHMENLNTRLTTDMYSMFSNCSLLNGIDLSHISTENVTNMYAMFYNCYSLTNLDLQNFNTSSVTTMGGMFRGCMSIETLDLSMFNTSNVTDMQGMFMGCRKLSTLDLTSFDTSKVIYMQGLFDGWSDKDNKVGEMGLTSLDLSSFNTIKVTNMQIMFQKCSKLQHIYVGDGWEISNVSNTTNMYNGCTARPERK